MADSEQLYGGDFTRDSNGRLVLAGQITQSELRIVRRLLTPTKMYIWHPDYGAGLPQKIGNTLQVRQIEGLIRDQLAKELSIAPVPIPKITISTLSNGVNVDIVYNSVLTSQSRQLNFDVLP